MIEGPEGGTSLLITLAWLTDIGMVKRPSCSACFDNRDSLAHHMPEPAQTGC